MWETTDIVSVIYSLTFGDSDQILISESGRQDHDDAQTICIWSVETGTRRHTIDVEDVKKVYALPHDPFIVVSTWDSGVSVYDAKTFRVVKRVAAAKAVDFMHAERRLVTAHADYSCTSLNFSDLGIFGGSLEGVVNGEDSELGEAVMSAPPIKTMDGPKVSVAAMP